MMIEEKKVKPVYIGYTMFVCGKCSALIVSFEDRCRTCGATIDRDVNLVQVEKKEGKE